MTIIFISIFVFALFDYFGYNISKKKGWVNEKFINPYRIIQALVQIGITIFLFMQYNFITALCFNILWWTWLADWIYYLYCSLLGIFFKYPFDTYMQVFRNEVTWAWWTPIGLISWIIEKKKNSINWKILTLQSLMGIVIVILIY